MNAAGPWRDDLENAPRNKTLRLLCLGRNNSIYELWSRFDCAKQNQHNVISWDKFNEPETTNVND